MGTTLTNTTNQRKRMSWQQMAAIEYRHWLEDEGGHRRKKKERLAAFDRIADKWAKVYNIAA